MTYKSTSKNKIFTVILLALLILQWGPLRLVFSEASVFSVISAAEPLLISNISVSTADRTATIVWHTNELADGMIEYDTDTYFDETSENYRFHLRSGSPNSTYHSIALYNLVPETTYHFRIVTESITQKIVSYDQIFKTKETIDVTAPDITRVSAAYVTGTTATIQWETNEKANSVVEYGFSNSYGSTISHGERVILHDLTLTGLQPGRVYYYRVKSTDEKNNTSISSGAIFSTDMSSGAEKETLYITNLRPVSANDADVTETSAIISYRTNKLADCKIWYGKTTRYTQTQTCPEPRDFFHRVAIGGLEPNTRYYYKVESKDVFSNFVTRENLSFTTRGGGSVIDNNIDEAEIFFYASYDTNVNADRASGNIRAVINNNTSLTSQNFVSGQAMSIGDNSSYVAYETFNNINSNRGTIAFWFRPNWNGNDNQGHTLLDISAGEGNVAASKYFLIDKTQNNKLRFWLENIDDSDFQNINYDASAIQAYQWYHIAITWDYTNSIADLYINGQKVGSDRPHGTPYAFNKYFYIGGSSIDYGAAKGSANGLFDEIKTYGRVLGFSEIQSLANRSVIGVTQNSQGQILGSSTLDYTQIRALYKESGSSKIYAIYHNGQKHYIPSPAVFESYGYSWGDVVTVPAGTLGQYRDAHLVKTPNNSAVYYIYPNQMTRKTIPSPLVFNSYPGNNWDDIITISEEDLAHYSEAILVQDIDAEEIYFLENGTVLREIQNEKAYIDIGVSKNSVAIINYTHLSTFILGEPMQ
ncbi:fibronectin type III domain-containing protein [Patescibacteria group bacterium]|nr:fibronectin type III domain-containing protein [Patescibacteria group bacterium]